VWLRESQSVRRKSGRSEDRTQEQDQEWRGGQVTGGGVASVRHNYQKI
jgi:hypothetical protein